MFSHVQSAFILGRSILDNAMIAIEIIHYLKSKTKGNVGDVALKVDTRHMIKLIGSICAELC